MKTRLTARIPLSLASVLLTFTHAHAADGTWNANAAGNWSDTTKWTGGTVADGADFTATFSNVITADRIVTVDSPVTIGNITASDADKNYTISGANTLTFDVTTGVSALSVTTSGRTLTISAPVTVSDGLQKDGAGTATLSGAMTALSGPQTWTGNAGTMKVTGGLSLNGNLLTIGGTGTISFAETANIVTGAGGITKNGTGVLVLGGAGTAPVHNYSGDTTINGGTVRFISNASANSNITINNGVYEDYWTATFTRTLGTGAGQIQILGGTSGFSENGATGMTVTLNNNAAYEVVWGAANEAGNANATGLFNPATFVLQGDTAQTTAAITFSNKLDLNASSRTIYVSGGTTGGARTTISGQIRTSSGTAGLTKTGGGLLSLSNASNAWNGDTVINGGILDLGGMTNANLGAGVGVRDVTVAAGAGIRFNALSNAFLNRLVETTAEIRVMTGTTANNLDFSSSTGANLPGAFLGNWASNGAKMEYSGTLTPASDNYRLGAKGSNGLLGIVGTNKLTGTQGLIVGGTGGSSIRVELAAAQDFTGDTVINTGARLTLGHNLAIQNSVLNVGAAGGNFSLAAGTNAGKITGETAAPSPTFGGLKGSRNLLTVFSNAVGNNETNLAATAVTGFTLNPGTGVTCTYSGVIANFAPATTVTKTGDGTQIFENTHTYTGATTVSGGTLSLGATGSIANSASLGLGAGATLDTSGQTSYAIPASQPLTVGIDPTGSGSSGKITADGLDITNAAVTLNPVATLDDAVYVLATYTTGSLTGTAFASVAGLPSGYTLDYAYLGNKIALVASGGGDVTPPTLTSITDSVSGGPVNIGDTVTYTVTFSEDMDHTTVTAADFGNDGGAGASIGTVTETAPGVFSVPVTATGPGTLILRINLNAELKDVAGNALDTDPALLDDTTITVRNAYQTWAAANAIGSSPDQDKDDDGVSNAVEFLLGGDVNTNDSGKLPTITTPGTDMVLTFQRKRSTIDTITGCVIGVGTTLATWPDAYTVGTTTGTSTAGVTVTENSPGGFDTITLTVPRGPDAKKFARLNVTVTP